MFLCLSHLSLCRHRITRPEVQNLLDIVHQAVEHPLYIDLDPTPKRESIKSFVYSDIAEDRLHYLEALAVYGATLRGVDLLLHGIYEAPRPMPIENVDLAGYRFRIPQAL